MSQTLRALPKPSPLLIARLRRNGFCDEIRMLEKAHGTGNPARMAESLLIVRADISTFQVVTQVATLRSFERYMVFLESVCDPIECKLRNASQFADRLFNIPGINILKKGAMFFAYASVTAVFTAIALVPTIVACIFSSTIGAFLNRKQAKAETEALRQMALIEVGNYTD